MKKLVLLTLMTCFVGCTYHGVLQQSQFTPRSNYIGKIPLNIGIVLNDNKEIRYKAGDGWYVDIKVEKVVGDALEKEMNEIFESATLINATSSITNYDLLLYCDVRYSGRAEVTIQSTYEGKFIAPKTKRYISSIESIVTTSHESSGSTRFLAGLTGGSLLLLSPITIPATTESLGKDISKSLLNNIKEATHSFGKKAAMNNELLQFATSKDAETTKIAAKHKPSTPTAPFILASTGQKWALIIGISDYKYSDAGSLPNLKFADDDAKLFYDALLKKGWSQNNINMLINSDANHRNIMVALESWLTKAGPNDQIVIYWSGHGYPDPEDPEKVYFATYDTDISIPATGYRMDHVKTALQEKNVKNVLFFADTCHAGNIITRGARGISIEPSIQKMQRDNTIPKGWIYMVSAESDRKAIEHTSWRNGAFTHCLIKGLSGAADGFQSAGQTDGIVTMNELKSYMLSKMPEETQRILGTAKRPVIATSSGDPSIWELTIQ